MSQFQETTLENGLRIVGETSQSAVSAAIGFFVKTGARDEEASLMGVSHFLEHMMFKGTETRSAEEVDLAFDVIGAQHNAFTSSEMTAFWGASLPEHIVNVHDILADILRPSLRQEDFDAEKSVILEEIAMYNDQPFWVLYEQAMEHYYGNHPLGFRVLGTPETIKNMQRDAMQLYFDHRYSADNTIVAMTGNIDFETMVDQIQTKCGAWKRTGATRNYHEPSRTAGKCLVEIPELHQHYLIMSMKSVSAQDERKYACAALASVLGGGDGSRLYWSLVDKGIAEEAGASVDPSDQFGEQMTYAVCKPENAEQVTDILQNEMANIATSLTKSDLKRVVAKAATAAAVSSELPKGRMQRLGSLVTTTGVYTSLEEELGKIESLTLDDLREAAESFPWKATLVASTKHER
ncbi:MAG: pitrilysin family protein [Phycisphaerales bacterium]|jgi:predicted Zn-dependent peptidase|nr:pitrilysin family protein [Phycisphaerales bacterium]